MVRVLLEFERLACCLEEGVPDEIQTSNPSMVSTTNGPSFSGSDFSGLFSGGSASLGGIVIDSSNS